MYNLFKIFVERAMMSFLVCRTEALIHIIELDKRHNRKVLFLTYSPSLRISILLYRLEYDDFCGGSSTMKIMLLIRF